MIRLQGSRWRIAHFRIKELHPFHRSNDGESGFAFFICDATNHDSARHAAKLQLNGKTAIALDSDIAKLQKNTNNRNSNSNRLVI